MEDWTEKIMELADMAKWTALIGEKNVNSFYFHLETASGFSAQKGKNETMILSFYD